MIFPVRRDHREMVRFSSAEDDVFQLVRKEIRAIIHPPQVPSSDPKPEVNRQTKLPVQHFQDAPQRRHQHGQDARKKACDVEGAL